jgi:hypothetical protein
MPTRARSTSAPGLDLHRPASTGRFGRWATRASVVLLAGGLVSLNVLAGTPGETTVATAWGYIGASLATMLGVVTGLAAATARMNRH